MDKAIKISIIAGTLLIALSISYYLVIFLPQKEKARVEQQKLSKDSLAKCLDDEDQANRKNITDLAQMKRDGKDFDLSLAIDNSEKNYQIRKADCFKKYPQ